MKSKFITIVIILVAFIFAIVLGTDVAASNYEALSTYVLIGLVVYFIAIGWKNVWWITALLSFSGVAFSHGLIITATHLLVLMLMAASILAVIHRRTEFAPKLLKNSWDPLIVGVLSFCLAYSILAFFGNMALPHIPVKYGLKTSGNAFFRTYATMFCFFWCLFGFYTFNVKPNWAKLLLKVLGICLLGNVLIRGMMFAAGYQATDGREMDEQAYFFYVPVINMVPGNFALRGLCPVAILLISCFVTTPGWWKAQSLIMKWIIVGMVILSIIGSLFSGGRATLILCLFFPFLVTLIRRKIALLMLLAMGGTTCILIANLFSGPINEAPLFISRSLQFILIEKGEAYESIVGSQDVRNDAFFTGIEEWQSDSRITLFGRSAYATTAEEVEYLKQKLGRAGFTEVALQTGQTHNLISDLLLQYGLFGAVSYILSYFLVGIYFWRLARRIPPDRIEAQALADAMKLYIPTMLFYSLLGGGHLPLLAALSAGLIRGDDQMRQLAAAGKEESEPRVTGIPSPARVRK